MKKDCPLIFLKPVLSGMNLGFWRKNFTLIIAN